MNESLLDYLPGLFREPASGSATAFVAQFLLAFQKILLGISDGTAIPDVGARFPGKSLEEEIAGLPAYLDPVHAPDEYLPWLAGWTAFTLRYDVAVSTWRQFIAQSVELHRRRGTPANLIQLLSIFTKGAPHINEDVDSSVPPQPLPPHTFEVTLSFLDRDTFKASAHPPNTDEQYNAFLARQENIGNGLIELAKPAHTAFRVIYDFPSMQIDKHSTVGVDTLLGQAH